jgi:predicted nucleotidyltransferase
LAKEVAVVVRTDPPAGFRQSVAETLPDVVRRIADALRPERIILFGSYAAGRPTPDSDVDLLVIMQTNLPAAQRYVAVSRLIEPRPFPVDIVVKTPDEVAAALAKGDSFVRDAVEHGQVLYAGT